MSVTRPLFGEKAQISSAGRSYQDHPDYDASSINERLGSG
jgi:hypothetical protein